MSHAEVVQHKTCEDQRETGIDEQTDRHLRRDPCVSLLMPVRQNKVQINIFSSFWVPCQNKNKHYRTNSTATLKQYKHYLKFNSISMQQASFISL